MMKTGILLISSSLRNYSVYLAAISFFVVLWLLYILTGFDGLYGQDGYAYIQYAQKISDLFSSGKNPGVFQWPLGYPLLISISNLLGIANLSVSGLMVSISSSVLCFICLYASLKLLFPHNKNTILIFLILFYCLSPFVFRASVIIMSDITAMAMIAATIFCYLHVISNGAYQWYPVLIMLSCMACLTRYPSVVVIFLPVLHASVYVIRRSVLAVIFSLMTIAVFMFLHLCFRDGKGFEFLNQGWFDGWSVLNYFRSEFVRPDHHGNYSVVNGVYVLALIVHPGFVFCGAVLALLMRKEYFENISIRVLAASAALYLLFLAGFPLQNLRFLLLAFPLILLLFFPAFLRICQHAYWMRYKYVAIILILIIQSALIARAVKPFYIYNRQDKQLADSVGKYTGREVIYTLGKEGLLRWKFPQCEIVSLWGNSIQQYKSGSLALLNPETLAQQSAATVHVANWQYLQRHYLLTELETMEEGWILYEIR